MATYEFLEDWDMLPNISHLPRKEDRMSDSAVRDGGQIVCNMNKTQGGMFAGQMSEEIFSD